MPFFYFSEKNYDLIIRLFSIIVQYMKELALRALWLFLEKGNGSYKIELLVIASLFLNSRARIDRFCL